MAADVTLPAVFLGGLISFVSPCVLPLVPPYLTYLAGTSLDQLTGEREMPRGLYLRVVAASIAFVLGFTTIFVLLGASASAIGRLLVGNLDMLAKIAGIVIIAMGLHFIGLIRLPLLNREARYQGEIPAGGIVGAYVMGTAFAFGWTPCIGPVLAVVLAVAASRETVLQGMGLLAVYSLGLGVPFILAALGAKPFMSFMARFRRHLGTVEKVMGGLLVLAGVMFITGSVSQFSYWLLETFPALGLIG
ncbi:MAG: cytochrome c biogenesis protein CcdA [Hyphomicrobiales bacterium]|nr:cytochrome c biogenesis protein CcdA [Hyphomicrobiales bacterium]